MNFFEEFLLRNNLKQSQAAEMLGISKQSVSLMCSGTQKVSGKTLDKLREMTDFDLSMLPDPGAPKVPSKHGNGRVKSIKILPQSAAAGYLNNNNSMDVIQSNDFIQFVDFVDRNADFAVRVDGDSMYPRYNSGDILACRILHDKNFFQWGKVYVLNTSQGCIVKKLLPCPGDNESVVCHSENCENYPDYVVSKSDILGIAIVVGHAGVE